jgi:hypothetical protein
MPQLLRRGFAEGVGSGGRTRAGAEVPRDWREIPARLTRGSARLARGLAAGDLARERQVDDGAAGVQLVRAGLDRPGVG